MSEDRVAPCNNSQEMFKEINSKIENFQLQMKVIKDTAIITGKDEIKSRWKEYCEDWNLVESVSAVRSKMRRPIRTAVRVAATNKGTKLQVKFLHKAQQQK